MAALLASFMVTFSPCPQTAIYLYKDDGTVMLPTQGEAANSSNWLGCFVGRNAAVDGVQVVQRGNA